MWNSFWAWYERTYTLNISVALGLFLLQIIHLLWLFGEVVWTHLTGAPLFTLGGVEGFGVSDLWEYLIIAVDYTEIPALLSVSLIYINELRRSTSLTASRKSLLYLLFLNSQWLHLFWITDEFVVTAFNSHGTVLPLWLAWVAIGIDYLEVPVMIDTLKKFLAALWDKKVLRV